MMSRWCIAAFILPFLLCSGQAVAQAIPPRFLVATKDSTLPSVEVNPRELPAYSKQVSLNLGRVPRREAIERLGVASGLHFVYANDLVAVEDSVSLVIASESVADALRAILRGASIDVVVSPTGTAVLVRRGAAVPVATAMVISTARASANSQVVEGSVRTEAGTPVSAATVIVTMGPVRLSRHTASDSSGRFAVRFDSATGDYLVFVSASGFANQRKRITVSAHDARATTEVILVQIAATQLDTVTVKEPPERPNPYIGRSATTGASRTDVDGVMGTLSPASIGDIAATALTVPGVASLGGGLSVLGLPGSQNLTTVDGAAFSGGSLPRAARLSQSVSTSLWDPSRGGFSGAQVETTVEQGTPFEDRRFFMSATPTLLSAAPGAASTLQPLGSLVRGSFVRSGEIVPDRLYAQIAADVAVNTSQSSSLQATNGSALDALGVTAQSRQDVLSAASTRGIPVGAIAASPRSFDATLLARFDWGGFDYRRSEELPSGWYATVIASSHTSKVRGLAAMRTTSTTSDDERTNVLLKIENNRQVGRVARNIASVNGSYSSERYTPRVLMPQALVATQVGGAGAFMTLGGGGLSESHPSSWNVEARDSFLWFVRGESTHRMTLHAWSRFDGVAEGANDATPGSFSYASTSDFVAGRAATYERTLRSPSASASTWNGALSLGDSWRASPYVRVIGGLRVEGNAFLSRPAANQALSTAFGLRNDLAPVAFAVSPRLGLTWTFDRARFNTDMRQYSSLGQFAIRTRSQLRIGVGEFRSLMLPSDGLGAARATGLAGSALSLQCIGSAVPDEDWGNWSDPARLPHRCRDGSGVFADAAPRVALLAKGFRPARSWRGSVGWNSTVSVLRYSLDATWSWQFNQPGITDVNFGGSVVNVLVSDGNRPVYVPLGDIDSRTGLSSTARARHSPLFGAVDVRQSDRSGATSAFTITLGPRQHVRSVLRVSYSYSSGWLTGNGFSQPTTGDPRDRVRAPANVPRHMLVAQAGRTFFAGQLNISGLARFQSGVRYTPLASQDINGDGRANDAAFIAGTSESVSSALSSASAGARRCLTSQVGRIAAIGSCTGPWQVTSNLAAILTPRRQHPSGIRWNSVSLNVGNPLGALDYLVHGSASKGWGAVSVADPVYLQVQGFDAATRRYRYAVNPRFGASQFGLTSLIAPIRVTLEVTMGLEPHPDLQQMRRAIRGWTEGEQHVRPTASEIVKKYRRQMPDPFKMLLEDPDSLFLSTDQLRQLVERRTQFNVRADSAWRTIAEYVLSLDKSRVSIRDTDRIDAATQSAWRVAHEEAQFIVSSILTPSQADVASRSFLQLLLKWNEKTRVRSYYF